MISSAILVGAVTKKLMTAVTISAIVPAAGRGARAKLETNKVLAPVAGQPLLWWTLRALLAAPLPAGMHWGELIIATRPDERDVVKALFDSLKDTFPVALRLVAGGAERQASVSNAVQVATGDFVLAHDAARPLVSAELIKRVCAAAWQDGAAIPALPASDTVKSAVAQNGRVMIKETLERGTIWLAQTPQVFRRELLAEALEQAAQTGFSGTDCASLVERLKDANGDPAYPVTIVEGEVGNFKVTYPPDFERATALLRG